MEVWVNIIFPTTSSFIIITNTMIIRQSSQAMKLMITDAISFILLWQSWSKHVKTSGLVTKQLSSYEMDVITPLFTGMPKQVLALAHWFLLVITFM